MSNQSDLVFLAQLATELGLTRSFLRRATREQRIPSLRAGGRTVYNTQAVRSALAAQAAKGVRRAK
jgi:hypothetical protein